MGLPNHSQRIVVLYVVMRGRFVPRSSLSVVLKKMFGVMLHKESERDSKYDLMLPSERSSILLLYSSNSNIISVACVETKKMSLRTRILGYTLSVRRLQ